VSGAPTVGKVLGTWHFDPALTPWLVAAAGLYVVCASRTRWRPGRTACFLGGLGVAAVALESGLDSYGPRLLSVHMVQHLALTLIAAPLLVLGAPVTVALRALPARGRRRLGALVASRFAGAVVRPSVGLAVFAATTLAIHLTGFYELALRNADVHALEHLIFLLSALLFWTPLAGADPVRHAAGWLGRAVCILAAMVPMTLVGIVLGMAGSLRYPSYAAPSRALRISALGDQHDAGAIMWVGGSVAAAVAALILIWAALRAEERSQAAREAHADRRAGVAAARP
jgi:putative copper resistance protein D